LKKSRSCFLHVQKSGGSSVISRLKSTLGTASVFHANESRYQQAPLDVLVAQLCIENNAFLLTTDRHFERIREVHLFHGKVYLTSRKT